MYILILGLVLFLGVHSVSIVNPAAIETLKAGLGMNAYRAIHSLVSLGGLALVIYGYGLARAEGVVLYVPPRALDIVTVVLMLFVFPLALASVLPGRIQTAAKHPLLAATKIWATAHLFANGGRADVLLFGAFLVWAVADRIAVKRHPRQPTPKLPPGRYNDLIAVAGGLALYAAFVLGLHKWLIGVPVPGPWSGLF